MAHSEGLDAGRGRGFQAAPRLHRAAALLTYRTISIVLAVGAIFGVPRPARADLCFTVDYRFGQRMPSRALTRAMEREASAIWEPYGVRFEWPSHRSGSACGPLNGSFDVLIERPSRPLAEQPARPVLGSTHLEPATIDHRPIRIELRAIEQAISDAGPFALLELAHHEVPESSDVGRALGRVLAHEIGHVLLAVHDHESHGLMRRSFGPHDLIAPERRSLTLSIDEVDRLRARERFLESGEATRFGFAGSAQR